MSKVTVPAEVARAISLMRKEGATNYEIIHRANGALLTEPDVVLRRWAFGEQAPANPDMLMSALVNGYEVEQSPEERLREYYEWYVDKYDKARLNGGQFHGFRRDELYRGKVAIESTLEILGITIEGTNA